MAASTTLLTDSRSGMRGGALPWALLVVGSVASLTANVAVAEPTVIGRVIAAWPSFALIGSYEMLMRQVRRAASSKDSPAPKASPPDRLEPVQAASVPASRERPVRKVAGPDLRREAWRWAVANRAPDESLRSGKMIADQHGRHERWGRLVKNAGAAGELAGSP